jgi:hypothetical protein
MLALRDLQTEFRLALFREDAKACDSLRALIADGDPSADERIAVYRNNVFASLTDVLKETFPAVCRLVDERFFCYVAHEFIADHPPSRPSLVEYGRSFPDFLADFPPCREFAYLPDVARFEWLMNAAAHASDAAPVSTEVLSGVAPEDAPRLVFGLHPSYGYLASCFPIDAIWRANRSCDAGGGEFDLDSGEAFLEVSRQGGDVVFQRLDAATFAFRRALAHGASLDEALERVFAIEPEFSPAGALGALFAEGAVAAATLPPAMEH